MDTLGYTNGNLYVPTFGGMYQNDANIPGLSFWLSASDERLITKNSSNQVINVVDRTGNFTLSSAGTGNEIIWNSFDKSFSFNNGKFLYSDSAPLVNLLSRTSEHTLIFSCQATTSDDTQQTLIHSIISSSNMLVASFRNQFRISHRNSNSHINSKSFPLTYPTPNLIGVWRNNSSSVSDLQINKTPSNNPTSLVSLIGTVFTPNFFIGSTGNSNNRKFIGKIFDILIFNRLLTDTEIEIIYNYIEVKSNQIFGEEFTDEWG